MALPPWQTAPEWQLPGSTKFCTQRRAGRGRPEEKKNTVSVRYPGLWITAEITAYSSCHVYPFGGPVVMGQPVQRICFSVPTPKEEFFSCLPSFKHKMKFLIYLTRYLLSGLAQRPLLQYHSEAGLFRLLAGHFQHHVAQRAAHSYTENRDGTDLGILSCITIGISASWEMLSHVTRDLIAARSGCCLVFNSGTTAFQSS